MKVAILGAGPAGLISAYAAERNELEPVIYAEHRRPSVVNDDMFLQQPLPGFEVPYLGNALIDYIKWGHRELYAEKVYGSPDAPVSWDNVVWGRHPAWWLKPIYAELWERYAGNITETIVTPSVAAVIAKNYHVTISTLPAPVLCGFPEQHVFSERATWLARRKNQYGGYYDKRERQEMIYNGDPAQARWFRHTNLNGWLTWEYGEVPPESEVSKDCPVMPGKKFLSNTCNCHPGIQRVGRWARWERGILNHHTYSSATGILASVGLGKGD